MENGELERVGDYFIELLGMGALSALDMAVKFGGGGRHDEQPKATFLEDLFPVPGSGYISGSILHVNTLPECHP